MSLRAALSLHYITASKVPNSCPLEPPIADAKQLEAVHSEWGRPHSVEALLRRNLASKHSFRDLNPYAPMDVRQNIDCSAIRQRLWNSS